MSSRKSFHRQALVATLVLALTATFGVAGADAKKHGHGRPRSPGPRGPHRRHLPGEPQLRQPLRPLAGRPRAGRGGRGAHPAGEAGRNAVRLPAAERREPHGADPLSDQCQDTNPTDGSTVPQPLLQRMRRHERRQPVPSTPHPASAKTCPDPGSSARRTASVNRMDCRRLHARPGASLLPGAVPARRREAGPLRRRAATRSASRRAYYDTRRLPIYTYLHGRHHPRYAIADNFFQAAFGGSFLNHQWLIAARDALLGRRAHNGGAGRPALRRRRERDADQLPLLHGDAAPGVKDAALTASCAAARRAPPRTAAASAATAPSTRSQPYPAVLAGDGRRAAAASADARHHR